MPTVGGKGLKVLDPLWVILETISPASVLTSAKHPQTEHNHNQKGYESYK